MYEPKYLPPITPLALSLEGVGVHADYISKYVPHNDPDADPLHMHGYVEIFFSIDADVSFFVDKTLYSVPTRHAIVSRPNDIHVGIFHGERVQEYVCLWIDAAEDSPLLSFLAREDFRPLVCFNEGDWQRLLPLLKELSENCREGADPLQRAALLLQILLLLQGAHRASPESMALPPALQRILEDIHQNYTVIRSVDELLKRHFISNATLSRWFRKYLHASPHEYLETQKLSHALTLLQEGSTVTEVASAAGFPDCSHFIVLFKRKFGKTPLQYKKQWRGE